MLDFGLIPRSQLSSLDTLGSPKIFSTSGALDSKYMDMWTSSVLLFKSQQVVLHSKDAQVEILHELNHSFIGEPVSNGRVFNNNFTV